jgi:hypothetical protein
MKNTDRQRAIELAAADTAREHAARQFTRIIEARSDRNEVEDAEMDMEEGLTAIFAARDRILKHLGDK